MKFLIKHFYPLALGIIVFILCLTNFTPNTWLTGWDNLHPEFNFGLNLNRSLFAVWQEYQGLGLLGGMGHAADLPRQLFLWIFSIIIPVNLLRYFYHFAMLCGGTLGIFYLGRKFIFQKTDSSISEKVSFVSSLFYLFNLGSIQYMQVPFEPYSTFWGLFPWEVYVLLNFLTRPNKKTFLFFLLVNVLAIPQGYVQTIFMVYIFCIGVFICFHLLKERSIKAFKISIFSLLSIFLLNSFWILPTLHFMKNNFSINRNAIQNIMATEKFYEMNKTRGTLQDFIPFKEFYYDFVNYDFSTQNFEYMMKIWRTHFENPIVIGASVLFFSTILLGLLYKGNKRRELAVLFVVCSIFFLSDTFPISSLNTLLHDSPIFDQLFRNSFTKWVVPTVFSFSFILGSGTTLFMELFKKQKKLGEVAILVIYLLLIAITSFPAFEGNYISSSMRINIPDSYFQLFTYLNKSSDKGRLANFPQSNIWGWVYYNWGLVGSGFPWYAIEQPVLDRAFDVWNNLNENYYWEISQAIYSNNPQMLEKLLNKYQVHWVLLDTSIFSYTTQHALFVDQTENILKNSQYITLEKEYGSLKLYHVQNASNYLSMIQTASNLPNIKPEYSWNNQDTGYQELGFYKTTDASPDIYYPFRSLFTGRRQEDIEFNIEDKGDYFAFKSTIPKEMVGSKLVIPPFDADEIQEINPVDFSGTAKIPQLYLDGELISATPSGEVTLNYIKEGNLEIRVPKINGYYSASLLPSAYPLTPISCDAFNTGTMNHQMIDDGTAQFTSIGSSNCFDFDLPNLSQRLGYLITIPSQNVEGKSLLFSVVNKNSGRADLETYLPKKDPKTLNLEPRTSFFIQPPMEEYGRGYTLHFDNISIGQIKTVNNLGTVGVNPIPYRFLTGIKIVNPDFNGVRDTFSLAPDSIVHPNPSYYKMRFDNLTKEQFNDETLILSQSFDTGWKAYEIKCTTGNWQCTIKEFLPFLFGKEIKEHVLVNNWENGWELKNAQCTTKNSQCTIVIYYLPQILEFIGLGLLPLPFIFLFVSGIRKDTHDKLRS